MKTQLLISTTAVLAVLSSAANAGERNSSFLTQNGGSNTALITQHSGSDNRAGAAGSDVLQLGTSNSLSLVQSGDGNVAGVLGGANRIHQTTGVSGVGAAVGNEMALTQSSDNNEIRRAHQTGGAIGKSNKLSITQRDSDAAVGGTDGNYVELVFQETSTGMAGADTTLIQDGNGNSAFIWQRSRGSVRINTSIDVRGNLNNTRVYQEGSGGYIGTEIRGDGNFFDMAALDNESGGQWGTGNSVGLLYITGNDNLVRVLQRGTGNTVSPASVIGDDNQMIYSQVGDYGRITGNVDFGDGNLITVTQTRTGSAVALTNDATVYVAGDDNVLNVVQTHSGVGVANGVDVDIRGSRNNMSAFSSPIITGLASGLAAGSIVQQGTANMVSLDVGTGLSSSSNNSFAFRQVGAGNTISGEVTGAGSNQAMALQTGSGNTSSFAQAGLSNALAVQQ